MPGIITITLNPAIDKSTTIPSLQPEKKLRCTQPVFEPGGGGVNVARAISKLGGSAQAIYFAGGYSGKFFNDLLDREGVNAIPVPISGHTRENLIVFDSSSHHQYRFGMPGPDILPVETQAMLDQLRKIEAPDYIVCSGSKPANVPDDIFARIAAIAKEKKARFIFDSSGAALKAGLRKGAFLIKPNRGELCALAGKEWLADGEIEKAAREVLAQYSIDAMLVSLGADGALLVAKDQLVRIKPPSVERQSTVGAGDSMVAGLVWQLSKGSDLRQAAGYGVACGTAATLNPGTQLCRKEDADKIFDALEWG